MKRNYQQELMEAIAPFVEDYKQFPRGFAETDNLNDLDECQKEVDKMMENFNNYSSAEHKRFIIKIEKDRWSDGKNAGAFGRYIARLEYLKTLVN
jgi:hypothetical protein